MKVHGLERFVKGWFIGPFTPTLHDTASFECAVKKYKAGDKEPSHYHKVATEYTVIVEGTVRMNGVAYGPNSIIEISPGEVTDFEALTDTSTVVLKIPATANDKYLGQENS